VWRDGTSHVLFEPIEFLEKLAAILPQPAVPVLVYHGILAPQHQGGCEWCLKHWGTT